MKTRHHCAHALLESLESRLLLTVSPTLAAPALAAASDTGYSQSDAITSNNNSTTDRELTFNVSGAATDATLFLYDNTTLIATRTAVSGTAFTSITTTGSSTLSDGDHQFTIRQQIEGDDVSAASPVVQVTIDTQPPSLLGDQDLRFGGNANAALANFASADSLVTLASGKVLVGGQLIDNFGSNAVIARLNADGTIDTSFGSGGIHVFDQAGAVTKILQQSGGNLVLGFRGSPLLLARLTANGALDSSFATSGFLNTFGTFTNSTRLAITSFGNIALASDSQVLLLDANGNVNTTFGTDGIATTSFPDASPTISVLTAAPNGQLLLGDSSDDGFSVSRLNANGSLDTNFADNGFFTVPSTLTANHVGGIALDAANNVLVTANLAFAGPSIPGVHNAALFRLTSDGTLDTSFGTSGVTRFASSEAFDILALPDNSLLVNASTAGYYHVATDGTIDTSYLGAGRLFDVDANAALASDGAILGTNSDSLNGHPAEVTRSITNVDQLPPISLLPISDTGTLGDNITSDTTPAFSIPGYANLHPLISDAPGFGNPAYATSDDYSPGTLTAGGHHYTIQYTDAAGNAAPQVTSAFVLVRTTQPTLLHTTIALTLPASIGNGIPLHFLATVTGDADLPPASYFILLDNGKFVIAKPTTLGNASFDFTLTSLSPGSHHFTLIFAATPTSTTASASATVVVPQNSRPSGGILLGSSTFIIGFATDADTPSNQSAFVRIDIDGKPVAVLPANSSAPVTGADIGNEELGHRFFYNFPNLSLGRHTLKVYVYDFPTRVPILIPVDSYSFINYPAIISVGSVTNTQIVGYTFDANSPNAPATLVIQVDNGPGVILQPTDPRPHVGTIGNGLHGFTYTLPTLSPGTHHITLMVLDTTGAGITQHKTFTLTT